MNVSIINHLRFTKEASAAHFISKTETKTNEYNNSINDEATDTNSRSVAGGETSSKIVCQLSKILLDRGRIGTTRNSIQNITSYLSSKHYLHSQ